MCWDISTIWQIADSASPHRPQPLFSPPWPLHQICVLPANKAPSVHALPWRSRHRLLTNPRLVSLRLTMTWRGCDSHVIWTCYMSVSAVTPETGWQLGLIPIQQEIINGFLDKSWRLMCHQPIFVVRSNSAPISLAWSFLFLSPSSLSVRVYATAFSPPIMSLLSFPTHSLL